MIGISAFFAIGIIGMWLGEDPPDPDGDGIVGAADLCPNVAGPTSNNGCPAPLQDRDGDGVPDDEDRCPTEAGPEDNDGCPDAPPPQDPDGDGVRGSADKCPTVRGPASNDGCPVSITERWRDDAGNVYTVRRNGAGFDGSANNVVVNGINYGRVQISGVVSPTGGNIMMTNSAGIVYQSPIGVAGPGTDPSTTDTLFGTMRFHIDH